MILTVPFAHPTPLSRRTVLKPKHEISTYSWGTQARSYNLNELVKKLNRDWEIDKSFGIAPITFHHSFKQELMENENFSKIG